MKIDLSILNKSQLENLQELVVKITSKIDTAYLICTGLRKEYCKHQNSLHMEHTFSSNHFDLLLICKEENPLNISQSQLLANNLSTPSLSFTLCCYALNNATKSIAGGDSFLNVAMQYGALLHQYNVLLLTKKAFISRKRLAKTTRACWSRWFGNACKFMDCALFCIAENNYSLAAFMVHQTVEHTCKALLNSFATTCPQTHNLNYLLKRCACFHPEILKLFPKDCPEDVLLIKQFKQSYIEARYAARFEVKEESVWTMVDRACQLQRIASELYKEKIERLELIDSL